MFLLVLAALVVAARDFDCVRVARVGVSTDNDATILVDLCRVDFGSFIPRFRNGFSSLCKYLPPPRG